MKVKVRGSEVDGFLSAPPSKSLTHRALLCSAMASGSSVIRRPLISDDTMATREVLDSLGIDISGNRLKWKVQSGVPRPPEHPLFCYESGTTLRFMTAFCALIDGECELIGGPSLSRRPMEPLLSGLRQLGIQCESCDGELPVKVYGGGLKGGEVEISGDISSQFISALLLVAPKAEEDIILRLTTQLESKPYVDLTIDVQEKYGVHVSASKNMEYFEICSQEYSSTDYNVEGDWSSAVFPMAAAALTGKVIVNDLELDSKQPDSAFMKVLTDMGIKYRSGCDGISVERGHPTGFNIDLSDTPDLFPVLTAMAAAADGVSEFRGLSRLRYKESDRILAMMEGLKRMGIEVNSLDEGMNIEGGEPKGGIIDPKNDHRIAMAFTVLGLMAEGETTIIDAECVSKSYPGFWRDMKSIGAEIELITDE
ncbi:MAG: 3-phosphoshikimate 1-carboxyvinyltransferase [Candidatus Bathyarchaeia archaeon]